MDYLLHRTVIAISLVILPAAIAVAQVEVSVPASVFKQEGSIEARVTNKSSLPVSYCVEFGQWSPHNGTIDSTPTPFHVESKIGDRWSTLMNGPDVGSSRRPIALDAGASNEFPFRLNDTGQMRLVLYYWIGERNNVCNDSTKERKTARSKVFSIVKE